MRRSQRAREASYTEKMQLGEMGTVYSRRRDHRQQTRTEVASYCPWARIHKQSFIETTLILRSLSATMAEVSHSGD